MANWDMTKVLKNRSQEVMERIREAFEDVDVYPDGSLWIRARSGTAPKELKKISREYAGARITAEHCMEADRYSMIYTCEYFCGVCTNTAIRLNYNVVDLLVPEGLDEEEISTKAIEILSKVDSVTKTDKGFMIDTNPDKEVSVSFIHKGYKIVAKKIGQEIEVDIYQRSNQWEKCILPF